MAGKNPTVPHDFGVLLNLAFAAFKVDLHAALAKAGFDDVGPSFGYVFRMLEATPLTASDLAQALGMTVPGALKIVNDMVAKGYVERLDSDGDARRKPLDLTPRARAAMRAAHAFHARYEQSLAARVGPKQAQAARRLLEAIVDESDQRAGRRSSLPRPI